MGKLSQEEFHATFGGSKERVVLDEPAPFPFWSYFDAIPPEDFNGNDCSQGLIENIWRVNSGRYEHVLINSNDRNVFMVLVLDLKEKKVFGHHLLNLNELYGLEKNK